MKNADIVSVEVKMHWLLIILVVISAVNIEVMAGKEIYGTFKSSFTLLDQININNF